MLSQWAASKPLPNAEMTMAYRLLAEGPAPEQYVVPRLMAELGLSERTPAPAL
jgi:hypothetical protein